MRSRRVVITGAGGAIGGLVSRSLATDWEICATDAQPAPGVATLDVSDLAACRARFTGSDAVVHLAADPSPEASWESLRGPNLEGGYAVCAAARECGVRRLVLASSLQALSALPAQRQRRPGDAPRPANLYGATKALAEALGSWVAATSATSVVALRIGHFSLERPRGDSDTPRNRAAWLSADDCVRLIRAAVEAERKGFCVVNGISANRHRYASLEEGAELIGYEPQDDCWV